MTFKRNFFKPALNCEGKVLIGYKLQIEDQNELLNTIRSALPEHLARHVLYCVISEKKISLYTDSATWSSQLRFYHQTILQGLPSSIRRNFEEIKIKVIPRIMENEVRKYKKIPSTKNIDLILTQAESQTDEKLKLALSNLAKTFKKLSK